jgi:DNA-binding NarL/FixJ family response regulator
MPPKYEDEGVRVAEALAEHDPPIAVLILSQHAESAMAASLLEQRTSGTGYLLKDRVADAAVLRDALERVAAGGTVVDPALVKPLVDRGRSAPLDELSPREREILALMAEGRSNPAICKQLFLSPKTIESHIRSIFLKLDLPPSGDDSRRVLAVLTWLRSQTRATS